MRTNILFGLCALTATTSLIADARVLPRLSELTSSFLPFVVYPRAPPPAPKRPLSSSPEPPRPAPDAPGSGGAARPAGAAGSSGGSASAAGSAAGSGNGYTRPGSFSIGNPSYLSKGEDLITKMRNPPNSADVANPESARAMATLFEVETKPGNAIHMYRDKAGLAFDKFGITSTNWQTKSVWTKNAIDDDGSVAMISSTYWNNDQKVLFTALNDNREIAHFAKTDIPKHSEIWASEWAPQIGQAKYVGCPDIINIDTAAIIKDARLKLAPGKLDTEAVTIKANSNVPAEKEAFAALAGSDNGAPVLRMLTDRHNMFGNRKVSAVHIWGAERGQPKNYDKLRDVEERVPFLFWELA
ncbi:hypothetical protein EJ08DRAFT_699125 [Tothia fuscella]|uniref:Uncharacterized protein n=1 Tax=Tothia fuscella TaxID=1048955 RepID=A0A9P4NND8_9PEZI|nr:hypothetical protein EJ08DRAFT_699125 [Tothia fuscella]